MKARGIILSLISILICALMFLSGCSGGGGSDSPSSTKAITEYSLNDIAGTINETEKTIAVTVPVSTDLSSLVATFTTTGTSVKVGSVDQKSGTTANNFTNQVVYTVIAADTSTQDYIVTVTVALSSEKAITAFSLNGSVGAIDETNKTIAVTIPSGTYLMDLVATFTTTGVSVKVGSTIQVSGTTAHNFTSPVIYKVTAADGTIVTYTVTVTPWYHPSSLSDNISPDGQDAYFPQVAMDNKGNAVIVWQQSDGSYDQIFKSEYRNGVWTHPSSLSDNISPDGQHCHLPQVTMDNNGNALIVWYQSDGTNFQIFKSEYRKGVWTHPTSLSDSISLDGQTAYNPQVAMDNNGNAIIVWQQSDASMYHVYHIFKSEYRNGAWHHPISLSDNISPDGQHALDTQVAMDDNGNAIIVWNQFKWEQVGISGYQRIFKSEYRGGVWTYPASLSDNISPNGQDALYPQVAMDNNGNAIIVWRQNDGTNDQIFKSEYRSAIWKHPTSLSDNISPDGQRAWNPQVAIDNNGNAIIVWYQYDGSTGAFEVFKSEYRSGAWKHPASIADHISPDAVNSLNVVPQVAMDNNGNTIIVWGQTNGATEQVFKSEYRSGVWKHPVNLSDNISPDGKPAWNPQAATNNNGNAVVVWWQYDGTNHQIFKSEYR